MLLAATPAAGQINPETCEGYPEPRVFLEAQTWWTVGRTATGLRSHHIHVGVCFPQGRTWRPSPTGIVRLDFRIVFHNMRGYLGYMFRGGIGCCDNLSPTFHVPVRLRCMDMECTWWITHGIDTDKVKPTGGRKLASRCSRELPRESGCSRRPAGSRTSPAKTCRRSRTTANEDTAAARGWYEGFGYATASIGPVPRSRSAGRRRLATQGEDAARRPRVPGYVPQCAHRPHVPRRHDGHCRREGTGSFDRAITIDTRGLTNGPHRLVMITHARRIRANDGVLDGTNTGVLSVPFFVWNDPLFPPAFPVEQKAFGAT